MGILISVFLPLALVVIMFSLGLGLVLDDFRRVFARPKAFLIGALAQLIGMPLAAFSIALVFQLPPALAFGLMILSFCPGGGSSNIFTRMAGADVALSISLTGVVTLISVVTVPLLVQYFAVYYLGTEAPEVNVTGLSLRLFALTAVPAAIGLAVRHFSSGFAKRIDRPVAMLSVVLFVAVVAAAVISNWGLFVANLPVLGPSVIALNVVLLSLGLALASLFSLGPRQATTIAIEVGIQAGIVGITVGTLIGGNAGELPPYSLPSGVYGVTMYLVIVPFILWRRGRQAVA
jgi:BASS family bile acid:Na+ symporter